MRRDLQAEAKAFDERIQERVRYGHIPDLRRVKPCDWFYNNLWRRPYLVDMVLGKYFRLALRHASGRTLLEVGSGAGYMSLEFARHGFHVTGLDLSVASVEIARRIAGENPYTEGFGSLCYIVADFLTWEPSRQFDSVCFFGTLHHFSDPEGVLRKVEKLLRSRGSLIVVEPARDWLQVEDAAIIALIRLLLAVNANWHGPLELPETLEDLESYIFECLREYREARDKGEPTQSPHDNAAGATSMLDALRSRFEEVSFEPGLAFMPRIGGGVRARSEEDARRLAEFLNLFDEYSVRTGLLHPGAFLWAGRKK